MHRAYLMDRFRGRPFTALAVLGAFGVAIALGGCGRKGPLDPPPSAAAPPPPQSSASSAVLSPFGSQATSSDSGQRSDRSAGVMHNGQAVAPKGPNKRIPLDALLD